MNQLSGLLLEKCAENKHSFTCKVKKSLGHPCKSQYPTQAVAYSWRSASFVNDRMNAPSPAMPGGRVGLAPVTRLDSSLTMCSDIYTSLCLALHRLVEAITGFLHIRRLTLVLRFYETEEKNTVCSYCLAWVPPLPSRWLTLSLLFVPAAFPTQ